MTDPTPTALRPVPTLDVAGETAAERPPNRSIVIDADGGPLAVGTIDLDTDRFELRTPPGDLVGVERAFVLLRHRGWPVGVEVLPWRDGELELPVSRQLADEMLAGDAVGGPTDLPISVVVCTRNRPELLARALPVLVEMMSADRELIVVDNAPQDTRTAQLVASYGHRIRYVVEPVPGLARARNCGLSVALGKFVVFTDDDVVPDPSWLDVLSATFGTHPGAVCVSGSVLPAALTTEAQRRFEEFGGYQRTFESREFHLSISPAPSALFPFHPRLLGTGANMAFRTEALRSLGGFDPVLGAGTPARGGEDIDIAVRILLAGHLLVRQPSAVIWHESHATSHDLEAQIESYGCGLAAAFTKFISQRATAPMVVRRLPAGLSTLLSADSVKNDRQSATYPVALRQAEMRGLRRGPFGYRASRRLQRRLDRVGAR